MIKLLEKQKIIHKYIACGKSLLTRNRNIRRDEFGFYCFVEP